MLWGNPPTDAELRITFGQVLNDILDGNLQCAPDGLGLDDLTIAALNDLASNMEMRASKTLVAYEVFADQLSGKHSRDGDLEFLRFRGYPG